MVLLGWAQVVLACGGHGLTVLSLSDWDDMMSGNRSTSESTESSEHSVYPLTIFVWVKPVGDSEPLPVSTTVKAALFRPGAGSGLRRRLGFFTGFCCLAVAGGAFRGGGVGW